MRQRLLGLFVLLMPLSACERGEDLERLPASAPPALQADSVERVPIPVPEEDVTPGAGVVYIPAYSHIFHSDSVRAHNLATTLSVRNTDPEFPITLLRVDYYDNDGRLVRSYQPRPRPLGPMASVAYVVRRDDITGGVGANFIVEWRADRPVTDPLMEAVMITTSATQGVSFTSRGQALVRR